MCLTKMLKLRLRLPVKHKAVYDVSGMDIDDQHSVYLPSVIDLHWLCDAFYQLINLLVHFTGIVLQSVLLSFLHIFKDILYLPGPPHLIGC